jgi:beta-N-acetylhexosaminidase
VNHGLALAGMANCGKHFPGHGYVKADSHVAIPVDERTFDEVMGEDGAPYDWLGMSLAAVMPAHVIYPKFDKSPAGFSKKWLTVLRKDLGFHGVIFSDDLSMQGATVAGTALDAAKAALKAGCDVALICNSPDKADQILAGLPDKIDAASAARIAALVPQTTALKWDALQQDAAYLAARKLVATLA